MWLPQSVNLFGIFLVSYSSKCWRIYRISVLKCHKGSEASWGPLQICHVLELQRLNQLHTWQAKKWSFRSALKCSFCQVLHPSIGRQSGIWSQQVSLGRCGFMFLAKRVVWRAWRVPWSETNSGWRTLGRFLPDTSLVRLCVEVLDMSDILGIYQCANMVRMLLRTGAKPTLPSKA